MSNSLTSRDFLEHIIRTHTELAKELLESANSDDENLNNSSYEMASIIFYLAGVEKMLNIAFGLLYLAQKVTWKWMTSSCLPKPEAGFVECQRGLMAKINKLKDLGAEIPELNDIVDLRNYFIHTSFIYCGYTQKLDSSSGEITLSPDGPTISFPLSPSTLWTNERIQSITDDILDDVSTFVDSTRWFKNWKELSAKLNGLNEFPFNYQPSFALDDEKWVLNYEEEIKIHNEELIGVGLKKLL